MAKAKQFPFTAYSGDIGFGDDWWPIRFQVAHGADGELRFIVRSMRYTAETVELRRAWDARGQSVPFFKLRGLSKDGVRFESDHVTIARMGTTTTATRTTLDLRLRCSKGVFRSQPAGETQRPFLRLLLRGFEAFPHLETTCRLGKVSMAGKYPGPRTERLSGHLQIVPATPPADFPAWRTEAEALGLHLQRYMSFAQARLIRAPVQQVWDGEAYEETVFSQSRRIRTAQSVIHPMAQKAYFERAVAAFFAPSIVVRDATYALEWFAMDASYTETRLMNAMTALENLTNSNLAPEETAFLADDRFGDLAKAMRAAARKHLADHPLPADADDADVEADAAMLTALAGKMRDLNRRPLKMKIRMLADRWEVPLADLLTGDGLGKAIRARDTIVHRGWYYEPAEGTPEQRDLWDHVLLMREIVIRFVLTTLAYKGDYISFRGGQHNVTFPPPHDILPGGGAG